MRVTLRADASPAVGLGHLNRCRILYDAFEEEGADPRLIVYDHPMSRTIVGDRAVMYVQGQDLEADWPTGDLSVVDVYAYEPAFYRPLVERGEPVVILDDCRFEVPEGVDAVVNPNVYASRKDYPKGCFVLGGPKYVLIRGDIARSTRSDNADSVFLCTGGSDPENQTIRLLPLLLGVTERPIHVVLGPGYEQMDEIEEFSRESRLIFHRDPPDVGAVMADCAYAVAGAGSMLYELAYLGVSTAFLVLAQNQKLIAEEFEQRGAAYNLGIFDAVDDATLRQRLLLFDQRALWRDELAQRAHALVPGTGGRNVARELLEWASSRSSP